MSQFYGTVKGQAASEATRCGGKASGITTHAAGWSGAIRVDVFADTDGADRFRVELVPWQSSGGSSRVLAEGLLDASAVGGTTLLPDAWGTKHTHSYSTTTHLDCEGCKAETPEILWNQWQAEAAS
jgi:hypothetical protein